MAWLIVPLWTAWRCVTWHDCHNGSEGALLGCCQLAMFLAEESPRGRFEQGTSVAAIPLQVEFRWIVY